ncbi:MAG: lysine--tRNA ligase, partial [Patescibacteria group bacterium]|nr:lysine--tRNA ligase [Patescibacteria group bacterium]
MNEQKISEYEERSGKLERLREGGVEPYPANANRTHIVKDVLENFVQLESDATEVVLCGRLRSKRVHGNLSFADIEDES